MRNVYLVALREYVENARTRGFWIGIFMLPVVLFLSFQVPMLLEKKGSPIRHFVLVDLSGQFERPIEEALEQEYQRQLLQALNEYARENAAVPATGSGERLAWQRFSDLSPAGIERFVRAGAWRSRICPTSTLAPAGSASSRNGKQS
jgi:hypothetical protein